MNKLFFLSLIMMTGCFFGSCDNKSESFFIGSWETSMTEDSGDKAYYKITFKNDHTAHYFLKSSHVEHYLENGHFSIEYNTLKAEWSLKLTPISLTFHPPKKNLYCDELGAIFKAVK